MVALAVVAVLVSGVVSPRSGETAGIGAADRLPPAIAPSPSGYVPAPIPDLNPDLCATTYRPSLYGPQTIADCRAIVAWRNAVVNHPDSVIGPQHPMALWGTGIHTPFNRWGRHANSLKFMFYLGRYVVETINLPSRGLAGPLPGPLSYVRYIYLGNNSLSGEIPSWMYTSSTLRRLSLSNNRLSGDVSDFTGRDLVVLELANNRFSGGLPTFDTASMTRLKTIHLNGNDFSGPIPASWSGLASRGIVWLDITNNDISGDLPAWVSNIRFSNSYIGSSPSIPAWSEDYPYAIRMSNNKICIPDSFEIPAYRKLNNQYAAVWLQLEPNLCPTSHKTLIRRAQNIQFEPVDAAGQPTTTNPVGLKVTWSKPNGMTGALSYRVVLYLNAPDQQLLVDSVGRYHKYCDGTNFEIIVGPSADANLDRTVTRSDCKLTDTRTLFDPTQYTADVSVFLKNQQTAYAGSATLSDSWSVFTAANAQKTFKDVANVLRLPFQRSIWIWDATNQIWFERSQDKPNFATLNLQPGNSLAFRRTVPISWLVPAGLSTADEDTPVRLENGWNVISAGGAATRPDNDNGAFFMDDRLIACTSLQGVIAIMRYNSQTRQFDAELPCHPRAEANLTRTPAIGTIENLEEADILFIYFQTTLPVTIQWDTDKYTPTS